MAPSGLSRQKPNIGRAEKPACVSDSRPKIQFARIQSGSQAVVGQFLIMILMARLVSIYSAARRRDT